MIQFIRHIRKIRDKEQAVFFINRQSINRKNLMSLRTVLVCFITLMTGTFLLAQFFEPVSKAGYAQLRFMYIIIIAIAIMQYIRIRRDPDISSFRMIYEVYTLGFLYCIVSGAFLTPQYVNIIILAIVFQIPILYLDISLRIHLFLWAGCILHLVVMYFFMPARIYVDEVINVTAFTILGMLIGRSVRASKIENLVMNNTLMKYAFTDQLTELYNRRKMYDDLKIHKNDLTGVLIFDIDFFKKYNDTFGHQSGDDCLKLIASATREILEEVDADIYRYGGEEFLVLMRDMEHKDMVALAESIRSKVESLQIAHPASEHEKVTISAGAVIFAKGTEKNLKQCISDADQALYKAKEKGRNWVIVE